MDDPERSGPPATNRGRAARRHHRSRMIERARRALSFMGLAGSERDTLARKHHDHLASCSCWMCGNPRRWLGEPTIQEQRGDGPRTHEHETDR